MQNNLEKFKKDLQRLKDQGAALDIGLHCLAHGKNQYFANLVKSGWQERDAEIYLKSGINFKQYYQPWYSECVAMISQLLPERLSDFIGHYEPLKTRKDVTWATYTIRDAIIGLQVTRGEDILVDDRAAIPHFQIQRSIVDSCSSRFESSLFDIKHLVQADLLDSELSAARELLKNGFLRAAGAVAGVALEKHLHSVCNRRGIPIKKKNASISDLNELLKSNSVVGIPEWREITLLADYRNICDHFKSAEPSDVQVRHLIDGTDKVLRSVF